MAEPALDEKATQRLVKAFYHGVEIEHLMERFGLERHTLNNILRRQGISLVKERRSPPTLRPGTKPRTGRWTGLV